MIIGSEGFIGKAFVDYYIKEKNQIEDLFTADIKPIKKKNYNTCDATKFDSINNLIKKIKPNEIYNFAGSFSNVYETDYLNNVSITKNIFESLISDKNTKCKVVINGSAAEYGFIKHSDKPINENYPLNPISFYGLTKVIQTYLAKTYFLRNDIQVYIVRPFNIIGHGISDKLFIGRILDGIKNNLENKSKIIVGNLDNERDYLDIEDLIRAYNTIVSSGTPGEIYNIGSGTSSKIQDILNMFLKIFDIDNSEVEINKNFVKKFDIPRIIADISKLKNIEWNPKVKLEDSVHKIKNMMFKAHNN